MWRSTGVNTNEVKEKLGTNLTKEQIEIRVDFLSSIAFRKRVLPPNTLIEITYKKYSNGICRNHKVRELAKIKINNYCIKGLGC